MLGVPSIFDLASVVLRVLLTAVWPQLASYDHDSILGLSSLGWVCFVAIWLVQLVILAKADTTVRSYCNYLQFSAYRIDLIGDIF